MRKAAIYILFMCFSVTVSFATYTYTITEYQGLPDLNGTESMLITGQGGGGGFYANDNSIVAIESTSDLEYGSGGVWEIHPSDSSHLTISGGQVHLLSFNNNATAVLTGGLIEAIYSYQIVTSPHITLYYSGHLPTVQEIGGFDYLVGQWGNGIDFSIYLHDTGYNTYGNFNFVLVPEPTTLALLSLGGLLIRRKK